MVKTTKNKIIAKTVSEKNYTGVYINPLTDFGFKRIFGTEGNEDLLIHFLNSILEIDSKIVSLQFTNVEQKGRIKAQRGAFFDLNCTTDKGEFIIVEMQYSPQPYFIDRALYYITFPIQKQGIKKKNWNFELKPVYSVNILNFSLKEIDDDKWQYYHKVMLMDVISNIVFYKKLIFVFLELPDFLKSEEKIETFMDWWYFILKNLSGLDKLPDPLKKNNIFKKLFEQAEIANMTSEELNEYEQSLKNFRNNMYTVDHIVKDYQNEIAKLQQQYSRVQKENTGLEKQNVVKDNIIADWEKQYTGLEKQNAALLLELSKLRKNY